MCKSSDLYDFNRIYSEYRSRFIRFACSYVREVSAAEDIANDAFLSFLENRQNIDPESNIPAYILTIVKNKCLDYLRSKETENRALSTLHELRLWEIRINITSLESCNPEKLFSSEVKEIIDTTLSALPAKTLEVYHLSRNDNKSHKEIADLLQISTKGVEYHITKALAKLKENLKDYNFGLLIQFFL